MRSALAGLKGISRIGLNVLMCPVFRVFKRLSTGVLGLGVQASGRARNDRGDVGSTSQVHGDHRATVGGCRGLTQDAAPLVRAFALPKVFYRDHRATAAGAPGFTACAISYYTICGKMQISSGARRAVAADVSASERLTLEIIP
jgi:hypothetical protein